MSDLNRRASWIQTSNEEWVIGPKNTNFYTRRYEPNPLNGAPKAAAVFVHGFQEHIGRYDHVFRRVQSQGVSVFAFDQRGWGKTACDEEHASNGAGYGLTRRTDQLADLEFFIKREKARLPEGVPLFLWGHSMGGGIVLSFVTPGSAPVPAKDTIDMLSGLVASAPLIKMAKPSAKPLRLAAALLSKVVPWAPFPASVPATDLSHDTVVVKAAELDPMMKKYSTIGNINDMLAAGDHLADAGWRDFPAKLPFLLLWGTEDRATSLPAGQEFFDHLQVNDKEIRTFEGAYHEIHNEPNVWKGEIDGIVDWMKKRIGGSADSGAERAKL